MAEPQGGWFWEVSAVPDTPTHVFILGNFSIQTYGGGHHTSDSAIRSDMRRVLESMKI